MGQQALAVIKLIPTMPTMRMHLNLHGRSLNTSVRECSIKVLTDVPNATGSDNGVAFRKHDSTHIIDAEPPTKGTTHYSSRCDQKEVGKAI